MCFDSIHRDSINERKKEPVPKWQEFYFFFVWFEAFNGFAIWIFAIRVGST